MSDDNMTEEEQSVALSQTEITYGGYNSDGLDLAEIEATDANLFVAEDKDGEEHLYRNYDEDLGIIHEVDPQLNSFGKVILPTNDYYSKSDFTQNEDGTISKNANADNWDDCDDSGSSSGSRPITAGQIIGGLIFLGCVYLFAKGVAVMKADAPRLHENGHGLKNSGPTNKVASFQIASDQPTTAQPTEELAAAVNDNGIPAEDQPSQPAFVQAKYAEMKMG